MAGCEVCGQEMLLRRSCTLDRVILVDGSYERVRFGAETGRRRMRDKTCGDCGAPSGGFHHPGCDVEVCPRCGHQAIMCGCGEDLEGNLPAGA
jgi:hypothetical protein